MRGAIAAGHPLSAEAGARVLRGGGNAVDALLAAAFTAFVTEGPLTGPAGGGFALVHEPSGESTVLDCFFEVPTRRLGEMEELVIDFGDSGTQVFHVGAGSVAVPGLLAGLDEIHGRFATREWAGLVEPAIALARAGFERDEQRAYLHLILEGILLRPQSSSPSRVCSPAWAGGRATAPGVRLRRGAGAGCRTPATSTTIERATLCGWAAASLMVSTGAKQTSVPSIRAHHSSLLLPANTSVRRSFSRGQRATSI